MAKVLGGIEINAEMLASLIKRLYEEKRKLSQYRNTYVNGGS